MGISVIFGSEVSLRVHYCKRDGVNFTTLLWKKKWTAKWPYIANADFRIVQIMVKEATFVGFRGGGSWTRCFETTWMWFYTSENIWPLRDKTPAWQFYWFTSIPFRIVPKKKYVFGVNTGSYSEWWSMEFLIRLPSKSPLHSAGTVASWSFWCGPKLL